MKKHKSTVKIIMGTAAAAMLSVMLAGCGGPRNEEPVQKTEAIGETKPPIEETPTSRDVVINGISYAADTTELDFAGQELDSTDIDTLIAELSQLDRLDYVGLYEQKLSLQEQLKLVEAFPDTEFGWTVSFGSREVDSKETQADVSGENLAALEGFSLLDAVHALPSLERIDVCGCGYSQEQLCAFQDALPEVKLVFEITMGLWTIRTDRVAFSTLKDGSITYRLTNEDIQPLKYCTDMVALDLGHNCVTDLSFLQYMPDLKILILVDERVEYVDDDWLYISDLSDLKYCTNLVYLEFFVGSVTDLSFLQYMPNLVDLNISWNPVSDASYLYNLPKIERLYLINTKIPQEDYEKLCELYPDAQIENEGESSIVKGWRTHERYYAMKDMYNKDYVHELFQ